MSELAKQKIGFLGAGNMVTAILKGLLQDGINPAQILLTDNSGKSAPTLAQQTGTQYIADSAELTATADILVLGMKPHQITAALKPLHEVISHGQPLIVSMAAGYSTQDLENALPADVKIVRIMPNVAARVGHSTTAVCGGSNVTDSDLETLLEFCHSFGTAQIVPENLFPAFTALAGCSPAWFAASVDALAQAGVAQGLSKSAALAAAAGAMAGAGRLIQETLTEGGSAADIVDRVCSPAGTTVAGLIAAEDNGLRPVWHSAVRAAVARDSHLSKN